MAEETVALSGRVNRRDFEFLTSFNTGGATTVSEKLRYALAFFRRMHEGAADIHGALELVETLSGVNRRAVTGAEVAHGRRSDLIHLCYETLLPVMALLISQREVPVADPAESEKCLRLFEERLAGLLEPLMKGVGRLSDDSDAVVFSAGSLARLTRVGRDRQKKWGNDNK